MLWMFRKNNNGNLVNTIFKFNIKFTWNLCRHLGEATHKLFFYLILKHKRQDTSQLRERERDLQRATKQANCKNQIVTVWKTKKKKQNMVREEMKQVNTGLCF